MSNLISNVLKEPNGIDSIIDIDVEDGSTPNCYIPTTLSDILDPDIYDDTIPAHEEIEDISRMTTEHEQWWSTENINLINQQQQVMEKFELELINIPERLEQSTCSTSNNDVDIQDVLGLLEFKVDPKAIGRKEALVSACNSAVFKDGDKLHSLLQNKVDKNRIDRFGRTPLHLAAWGGIIRTIAMLLDFPIELEHKLLQGITPESEKEIKALKPLVKSRIDIACELPILIPKIWLKTNDIFIHSPHIPNIFCKWTPLHIASFAAHPNATRLLLAVGANPNSEDAMENTPLDVVGRAFYLDSHKISQDDYLETMKTLIEYGGHLNTQDTLYYSDAALHFAVKMCNIQAIKLLLDAGAPITQYNGNGNTPLHECVSKFLTEPLKVLANYRRSDQTYASVDVTDTSGYTVLHRAILASWMSGVCVALDAGADLTLRDKNGFTAIHLAALKGNIDILNKILNTALANNIFIQELRYVDTVLFCAIRSSSMNCVKIILETSAKLIKYTAPYSNTLLKEYANSDHVLEYKCRNMIAVEFAALHKSIDIFKYILQRTVEANEETQDQTFNPALLLDIVILSCREDMLSEIFKLIPDAVYTAIKNGCYPLHRAIQFSNRTIMLEIIKNGADLLQCDAMGNTSIDLFMEHLSKPTEFIASIFDCYIQTNGLPFQNRNSEITVDYNILIHKSSTSNEEDEMGVINAIIKTGNNEDPKKLLGHPLIESYLYLKWKTFARFFYVMLFLYSLFVMSLSIYIVSVFYYKDQQNQDNKTQQFQKHAVPKIWNPTAWQCMISITLSIIIVQELSRINLEVNKLVPMVSTVEFWVKSVTYVLVIVILQLVTLESPDLEWRRHLATLTLIVAWFNIMLLLSNTPVLGYYMQMFWEVSLKTTKILIIFSFVIIVFSFCFMIQFHARKPFEDPWSAFLKTLVMMTSEFDYNDTFTNENIDIMSSLQVLRVIFVVFMILAAIVLMNLIVGVAVHDVQKLVLAGNLRRLKKQVEFLNSLEVSRGRKSIFHFVGLYKLFKCEDVPRTVTFKLIKEKKCYFASYIKESLMDNAQDQLDNLNRITNESKLDEVLQALVLKEKNIINHIEKLTSIVTENQKSHHTQPVNSSP